MYSTGAQGFKNLPVFASSALIVIICLFFSVSGASAQGSAATSGSAAAQSRAGQGQAVQLEGELEILQQDFKDGRDGLLYSLKRSDGTRVPLHFANQPPRHLLTGDHVRASGQLSGGTLILYSGSSVTTTTTSTTTTSTSSIPLPNTFGAQSTLVILVNFQDAPSNQPWTLAQVQSEVFGGSGTSGYLQEASYGQTSLTGNVYGWYTIAVSSTVCDTNQIATAANNAASAAGANLAAYTRLVYVFPYTSACGWAGAATIGGSPSQSWINGGGTTTNALSLGVFAHEMGHNLGLYHSHGLDCGSVTLSGQCTVWEYFDSLDVMGSGQGHYNSFQKERLGWLNYGSSPPIIAATASGTYTLAPYEAADSNSKALKVLKFTNPVNGASYYYYLEYRQPLGFDSFISGMASQNITNGVVIHLAQDGNPNSSDLLDMTPDSSIDFDWNDVALAAGATYSDPDAGVAITTQSVGSGATVSVSITAPSCVRALPAISISPSQASPVTAGSTVSYTVAVTDNDSSSCGVSTFSLQPAITYGWTDNLSSSQLTLSPGQSSSTTLSVTSSSNSNNGSNPVGVTATNIADFVYSGSAWATYSVGVPTTTASAATVSVTTSQTVYSPGQTVAVNATVGSQGNPVANASVTFNVTNSNGATVGSGSGTTGSNGTASFKVKLGRHVAKGTYAAIGQTSLNGVSADGSASFLVQ